MEYLIFLKLGLNGKASIIEEEEKIFSYLSGFLAFMVRFVVSKNDWFNLPSPPKKSTILGRKTEK